MATIYDLKPRFQPLLRPFNATLVSLGISANMITLTALLLSGLLGMALAFGLIGLGIEGGAWSNWLLWAMALASAITLVNRGRQALKETPDDR